MDRKQQLEVNEVLAEMGKSYPAPHFGRPGEVGGSAPREEGGADQLTAEDDDRATELVRSWDIPIREFLRGGRGIEKLTKLSMRELRKRQDIIRRMQERNSAKYLAARKAGKSTAGIEGEGAALREWDEALAAAVDKKSFGKE